MKLIASITDQVLRTNYDLCSANTKVLSLALKTYLKALKINFNDYNSSLQNVSGYIPDRKKEPKVPLDIYEYQNFFLLKVDKNYLLLDGFRRLLWYNSPDTDILVRVYDRKNLTDKQILQILVSLNHTKFFGGIGDYFDRGFSLALKTIFDLDILKFYKTFDAYLSKENTIKQSWSWGELTDEQKNEQVSARIVSDKFVEDMRFIQDLLNKKIMLNNEFGALIWNYRTQYPDAVFSAEKFVELCLANKYIVENYEKYKKSGDGTSAESVKVINRQIELYDNVFKEMLGLGVAKSFLEVNEACKEQTKKFKKDKNLYKITDTKSPGDVEKKIIEIVNTNKLFSPKLKVVVYPYDESKQFSDREKKDTLPAGIYEDFYLKKLTQRTKGFGAIENTFLFENESGTVKIKRSSVSRGSYYWTDNYNGVQSTKDGFHSDKNMPRTQDADVFICLNEVSTHKITLDKKLNEVE